MEPETITALIAMGSIIFVGFFGNLFFNRFRIPDVLLLIFLGMAIGPDILGDRFGLVTTAALGDIDQFKDLFLSAALIIILFDGGLSLDMRVVFDSMRISLFHSILTFIVEITVIAGALHLVLDMDFFVALTLGTILGGTTGAVVIPIVNKMRLRAQTKSMLIMESVITDVLVIVVALALISVVKIGEFDIPVLASELIIKFVVGAVVGFVAGAAWLFVLDRLHKQPLSYMITVAALFIIAGVVEMDPINSSGAVAALTFGLSIGNRQFVKKRLTTLALTTLNEEHIHHFHTEITFFVRTFFFVYLGLAFRFDTITWVHLMVGILIIWITLMARYLTSHLSKSVGDMEDCDRRAVFGMMPKGLSAAVLATLPAAEFAGLSVWSSDLADLFLNVTLIVILGTTTVATVLSFFAERGVDKSERMKLRQRLTRDRQ
jgi:cell volume regulation protein A